MDILPEKLKSSVVDRNTTTPITGKGRLGRDSILILFN